MTSIFGYLRLLFIIVAYTAASQLVHAQVAGAEQEIETSIDFETLHETWLESDNLQLERPIPDPPPEADTPPEPRQSFDFFRWLADVLNALGPVFRIIFYIGLAFVICAILYFILTQLTDIRIAQFIKKTSDEMEDDVLVSGRPNQSTARSLLEEADALASAGKFSEAVHLLLFRSIQDIRSKREEVLPDALTAREIGNLADLPDRPRNALKPIVSLVERSFFGGRELVQSDWKTARASYEDFAFGDAWA